MIYYGLFQATIRGEIKDTNESINTISMCVIFIKISWVTISTIRKVLHFEDVKVSILIAFSYYLP